MTYIIAEPCVGLKDSACVDVCPVDCIYTRDEDDQYYISPDECIDCAACEPVCPYRHLRRGRRPPRMARLHRQKLRLLQKHRPRRNETQITPHPKPPAHPIHTHPLKGRALYSLPLRGRVRVGVPPPKQQQHPPTPATPTP